MLTLTAQTQLAEAMAQMMRSCALAATRAWTTSALRGLSWWSQLVAAPPAAGQQASETLAGTSEPAAGDDAHGAFASYRSGGGHAVAQVIVPR